MIARLTLLQRFLLDVIGSFNPKDLTPPMRRNYLHELLSWCFLPFALGAIEGGTMGVVVKKAFHGAVDPWKLDLAVAVVTAAPNAANLCSFIWASLSHGRRKVPFIAALQLVTCLCVALIAAIPVNEAGLLALCLLVFVARACWTGVITVRTAVWRHNWPKGRRAGVAGKMATMQALVLALCGAAIGQAMDLSPRAWIMLFPTLAAIGLVGNAIYRRVVLLNEEAIVAAERAGTDEDERPTLDPRRIVTVLREDPLYRSFMLHMFVFGLGNLMLVQPQVSLMQDEFGLTYFQGILATTIIPTAIMPLAIPLWSRLMDRMHIARFRAIHGWSFVVASLLLWLATLLHNLPLFYAASVALGVGFAGGVLAWNLGHHDFAPPHRDAEYMAVHVTLNGLRGLIAPFVAAPLYAALPEGSRHWVFALCTAVNVAGMVGFVALARRIARLHRAEPVAPRAGGAGPA